MSLALDVGCKSVLHNRDDISRTARVTDSLRTVSSIRLCSEEGKQAVVLLCRQAHKSVQSARSGGAEAWNHSAAAAILHRASPLARNASR